MITALWREVSHRVARRLPPDRNWVSFSTVPSLGATKALDGIRPIMNERLSHAIRIQEAIIRGAPANEVEAERRKYLAALPEWNAALQEHLSRITRVEFKVVLLSDDLRLTALAVPCPDDTACRP